MGILSNDQLQKYLSLCQREKSKPEPLTSTEPIVGYRIWATMKQGGQFYLRSVAYPTPWPYRKALEKDALNDKGIHALKSGKGLLDLWSRYYEAAVAGEVYLWGRVTECELGYLAQFAYPKRLFVPDSTDPTVVMGLEDGYGVPCEMRPEFVKQPTAIPDGTVPGGTTTVTNAGIGQLLQPIQQLYPQSWAQQQLAIQALQNTQQANVAAMMQNAMLYGTGIAQLGNTAASTQTYPGQIVEVDLDTYGPFLGLPGK